MDRNTSRLQSGSCGIAVEAHVHVGRWMRTATRSDREEDGCVKLNHVSSFQVMVRTHNET
ncbi:hypothetical protein E2C01_081603 [Portunus trituberculatus]|uniref:Uncharacterized protein n=1 Tax=Portunus trituberculatus TaxID=210409 RepID=A0A5B7IZA5_PORTR|nr:hypothetical protein [Portunus trituberculatus]